MKMSLWAQVAAIQSFAAYHRRERQSYECGDFYSWTKRKEASSMHFEHLRAATVIRIACHAAGLGVPS